MGLAEKRMAAGYQADSFPVWEKKINAIVGKDLTWDVKWGDLFKEGFADSYPKTIDYNYFMPLEKVLTSICSDQMGKDAFNSKIKKVLITCDRAWSSIDVKIEGETLHIDADPTYNRDESTVENNGTAINKVLEKAL